jgi:hypothetical protein
VNLQLALQHLEALFVSLVVVRRGAAVRGDLDLNERALTAALLAGLEEGGVVLLLGMVVAPFPGRLILDLIFRLVHETTLLR